MTIHATLGASSSHRWLHCPGSIQASLDKPRTSSAAAERGTHLHERAEITLRTGVPLSKEDADVQPYVDWVQSLTGDTWLETRVRYGTPLGVSDEEAFGTADCINLSPDKTVLTVGDLKTGAQRVDPVGNPQLVLYAIGALDALDMLGLLPEELPRLRLVIIQPRISDNPVVWETSAEEILKLVDDLAAAAKEALSESPRRSPHEDACRWCPAKLDCAELRAVIAAHSPPDLPATKTMHFKPVLNLREHYEKVDLLRIWVAAIEEEMMAATMRGEHTGYKLVEGRKGNRRFSDPAAVTNVLSHAGVAADTYMKPPELLSPAQMEKALRPHKEALDAIQPLIETPAGKPTLVPVSDPRPQFVSSVADRFSAT